MTKISNLTILTVPSNRTFVVAHNKSETFKNVPKNEKLRKRNDEFVKKIKIKIN